MSMSMSGLRDKRIRLWIWSGLFSVWIFVAYACLIQGIGAFFMLNHYMIDMLYPHYPAVAMYSAEADNSLLAESFYENEMQFVDMTTTHLANGSLGFLQWRASMVEGYSNLNGLLCREPTEHSHRLYCLHDKNFMHEAR